VDCITRRTRDVHSEEHLYTPSLLYLTRNISFRIRAPDIHLLLNKYFKIVSSTLYYHASFDMQKAHQNSTLVMWGTTLLSIPSLHQSHGLLLYVSLRQTWSKYTTREAEIMLLYAKDMTLVDDLGNLVDGDETGCEDAGATDAEGEHEGEGTAGSLDSPIRSGDEHMGVEHGSELILDKV
jgi:hypothetical protein